MARQSTPRREAIALTPIKPTTDAAGTPERAALLRVADQLERACRAALAGAHGSDPALGAAMVTGILKRIEPDLATLRVSRRKSPHATREIVALAKEWYAGLVAAAAEKFRPQLASGKYRRFREAEADAELQRAETKAGRKFTAAERDDFYGACCARHSDLERALRRAFIEGESAAHLVLLATTKQDEADPSPDPRVEASDCLALDVFDFFEKSTTTRTEGRAA